MSVVKRNEKFYLRKRVPGRYSSVEMRGTVWVSLHTDSKDVASQKAPVAWEHLIQAWEARLVGNNDNAEISYSLRVSIY